MPSFNPYNWPAFRRSPEFIHDDERHPALDKETQAAQQCLNQCGLAPIADSNGLDLDDWELVTTATGRKSA